MCNPVKVFPGEEKDERLFDKGKEKAKLEEKPRLKRGCQLRRGISGGKKKDQCSKTPFQMQ